MKLRIILLVLVATASTKHLKAHSKSKATPKAFHLQNHFGIPSVENIYGPQIVPKDDRFNQLLDPRYVNREPLSDWVEQHPETVTPFKYHRQQWIRNSQNIHARVDDGVKMNPTPIKSGEFTNIAPAAQTIITPNLTMPKVQVKTEFNYPANVKLPEFHGFRKVLHPATAYDRWTGQIVSDRVAINQPIYGYRDGIRPIKRQREDYFDVNSGKPLDTNPKLALHGLE